MLPVAVDCKVGGSEKHFASQPNEPVLQTGKESDTMSEVQMMRAAHRANETLEQAGKAMKSLRENLALQIKARVDNPQSALSLGEHDATDYGRRLRAIAVQLVVAAHDLDGKGSI